MNVGSVTYEEFLTWPEKYQKLWNSVKQSRRGLWQACAPEWINDQILEACDEVADFIRKELGR